MTSRKAVASVPGRPNGMVDRACDCSNNACAKPRYRQSCEGNVVFREEVQVARTAIEHTDIPFALRPHASRGLDHRPAAVRASGGFGHGTE
jgi:hypothetical protein